MKTHQRSYRLEESLVKSEASDFEKFKAFHKLTEELEVENAKLHDILQLWGVLHNTPPLVVGEEWKDLFNSVFALTCEVLKPTTPAS